MGVLVPLKPKMSNKIHAENLRGRVMHWGALNRAARRRVIVDAGPYRLKRGVEEKVERALLFEDLDP